MTCSSPVHPTSGIVKEHIIVPVANMYIGSGRGIGMSMTMPFCCDESRSKPALAKVLLSVLAKFPVLPMLVLGKVQVVIGSIGGKNVIVTGVGKIMDVGKSGQCQCWQSCQSTAICLWCGDTVQRWLV